LLIFRTVWFADPYRLKRIVGFHILADTWLSGVGVARKPDAVISRRGKPDAVLVGALAQILAYAQASKTAPGPEPG